MPEQGTRYCFGPFELNTGTESLSRNGTRVKVQDLPYRLLVLLVERPGEIVTREEVRQRLWPQNTFVEFDNSLGVAVRKVRDALNDDADTPRYLETLPRRGYRFVAPVTLLGSETAAIPAKPFPETPALTTPVALPDSDNRQRHWVVALSVALIVVGAVLYGLRSMPRRASSKLAADGWG